MSIVTHQVILHSTEDIAGRLPAESIGCVLAELPAVAELAISLSVRHRSTCRGKRPDWLLRAADVRFVGHDGAILLLEAPTLAQAAPELYRQGEFWPTRPDGADTGLDLLGDLLAEVATENPEGENFDAPLLRRLSRFRKVFEGPFDALSLITRRYTESTPASMTRETLAVAEQIWRSTPVPQRVRVVGSLDMLRVSTRTFALRLDDGHEIRGVLPDGMAEQCGPLLNRRVLVRGKAVFRPSGRLLRVDADTIDLATDESGIWSRMPTTAAGRLDHSQLRKPQGPRSGMSAILGKWPGDETDEQISEALEQLS